MRSFAIFYISHDNPHRDRARKAIIVHQDFYTTFIRAEIVEANDAADALKMAQPERGETTMNAHPMVTLL